MKIKSEDIIIPLVGFILINLILAYFNYASVEKGKNDCMIVASYQESLNNSFCFNSYVLEGGQKHVEPCSNDLLKDTYIKKVDTPLFAYPIYATYWLYFKLTGNVY